MQSKVEHQSNGITDRQMWTNPDNRRCRPESRVSNDSSSQQNLARSFRQTEPACESELLGSCAMASAHGSLSSFGLCGSIMSAKGADVVSGTLSSPNIYCDYTFWIGLEIRI